MVYQISPIIQRGKFSCVEELKCDALENLLRIPENVAYNNVNFLVFPDTARKLYTTLLNANVNGFSLHLFEEDTNEDVTNIMVNNTFVVISINNQGTIFVEEKIYVESDFKNDFWYIEDELFSIIKNKVEQSSKPSLVFSFE